MGRATIYYSRASWHLTCRLVASLFRFSFCQPVDLLVSFSFSFSLSLSLSHNALSWSAFPCGWIAARGYVRNCGTKSASAEELTVHCGGHKTLLILIDSISGNRWLEVMTRLYSSYRKLINHWEIKITIWI